MNSSHTLPEVSIVGMGLIGGSLGLALRRRRARVRGVDTRPSALRAVRKRDRSIPVTRSRSEGVKGAGLVVLCVPLRDLKLCLRRLSGLIAPDTVVTDTTSVKSAAVRLVSGNLRNQSRFVGGHPMAGSERSGFGAASASLFSGRPCILTPVRGTRKRAVALVTRMWKMCGAVPLRMLPLEHDRIVARVSHLPHALAAVLVNYVLRKPEFSRAVSASFLDATRVASSPAGMWRDIFQANGRQVSRAVLEYARLLARLGRSIESDATAAIHRTLRAAAAKRKKLGRRGKLP